MSQPFSVLAIRGTLQAFKLYLTQDADNFESHLRRHVTRVDGRIDLSLDSNSRGLLFDRMLIFPTRRLGFSFDHHSCSGMVFHLLVCLLIFLLGFALLLLDDFCQFLLDHTACEVRSKWINQDVTVDKKGIIGAVQLIFLGSHFCLYLLVCRVSNGLVLHHECFVSKVAVWS